MKTFRIRLSIGRKPIIRHRTSGRERRHLAQEEGILSRGLHLKTGSTLSRDFLSLRSFCLSCRSSSGFISSSSGFISSSSGSISSKYESFNSHNSPISNAGSDKLSCCARRSMSSLTPDTPSTTILDSSSQNLLQAKLRNIIKF